MVVFELLSSVSMMHEYLWVTGTFFFQADSDTHCRIRVCTRVASVVAPVENLEAMELLESGAAAVCDVITREEIK